MDKLMNVENEYRYGIEAGIVEGAMRRGTEHVLEEMEKFCYLGHIISYYGGASEAVSKRNVSVWKTFRDLSGVLVGKQGLSLKQLRKIYQCCVRPVLWNCCEMWQLNVVDKARLCRVEHWMISTDEGLN